MRGKNDEIRKMISGMGEEEDDEFNARERRGGQDEEGDIRGSRPSERGG